MPVIAGPHTYDFGFILTTQVLFGRGVVAQVGERAQSLGLKKALVVTDSFIAASDTLGRVVDSLAGAGIEAVVWDGVVSDPTDVSVTAGTQVFRERGCGGVIGLGGGSSMDTAKGIGVLGANGGDRVLDYRGPDSIDEMAPLIAVPTTAGTGSEVTSVAVITDAATHFKSAIVNPIITPAVALVDPDLTLSMPRVLTIGAGIDVLAHAVESYTARGENPFSDALALYAIDLTVRNLPLAAADGANVQARADMSLASTMAGAAFSVSRLTANHSIAHALGELYHVHHGLACGIGLAPMLEYNLEPKQPKLAHLSSVFGVQAGGSERSMAEAAIASIDSFVRGLGVHDLVRARIDGPVDIQKLAELSYEQGGTRHNPRMIDVAGYVRVLERAFNL